MDFLNLFHKKKREPDPPADDKADEEMLAAIRAGYKRHHPDPNPPPEGAIITAQLDGKTGIRVLRQRPFDFAPSTLAIAQATDKLLAMVPGLHTSELFPDKELKECVVLGGVEGFTERYVNTSQQWSSFEAYRQALFFDRMPAWKSAAILYVVATLVFVIGGIFFRVTKREFVDVI